jgi:K+-transporting ATPase ATPase C chain
MFAQVRAGAVLLILFTLLTGAVYPLAVTGLAQWWFPFEADGSLVMQSGQVAGSALVGQPFTAPGYFWGRPSATATFPYNAAASAGSNLGPSNPVLAEAVVARIDLLQTADPGNERPIPVDLVTASASGLDPHISVAAALYQVPRVARARGVDESQIRLLVESCTEIRQFGILGEPRVNVLQLNLALDQLESICENAP